jgi:hypothetical protein
MKKETKNEIQKLIALRNESKEMTTDDPRIEDIADRFPNEYTTESEYISFQEEIAEMIGGGEKE